MSDDGSFNPKNPNNFNVDAQLLLIPGLLIILAVGKKERLYYYIFLYYYLFII